MTMQKIKAYFRLVRMQERRETKEVFVSEVYKAIKNKDYTDLEISIFLKELNALHVKKVSSNKKRAEMQFLDLEKSEDFNRTHLM